ncbi:hypothetical protein RYX51_06070 [Priestia filamentosa]|nr:hypothetical protein RYX51_06070 [Priestia filamentosa]
MGKIKVYLLLIVIAVGAFIFYEVIEIDYDEEYQSAKATFTVKSTDEPSTINGTKLTPGTYTLWYENEQSIKAKLQLIQKYNLKGAGIWNLGKETAQTWDYFEQSLNASSEK